MIAELMAQIFQARRDAGISQAEAGRRAAMDRSFWAHCESGRKHVSSIDTIARMAAAVGLTLHADLSPAEKPAEISGE